jgi:hypothetical protein
MDAVVWKGKAIQDYGLTPYPLFFSADSDFLVIMILDNLGKNQVNLTSIFLSWVSGMETENKEMRIHG